MNQNEQNTPSGKMYVAVPVSEALPEKTGNYSVIIDGDDAYPFQTQAFRLGRGCFGPHVTHWLREVEAPLPAPVPSGGLVERITDAVIEACDNANNECPVDARTQMRIAKACAQIALNISPENVQP